ncbi:Factor of dna methylation [Thalictrum thalictroides]|uniref:Factor of dna methylation n=1 Tax=Thalictrum thalictroides TaxID=46969 RepID=A0A7J6V919_THATH|nr:Factor of dna methylation [Thalictrum thalictroides]
MMQQNFSDHFEKIIHENEKLKSELDREKKDVLLRRKELEKHEAKNECERRKLIEEGEEQKKADEDVVRLAENHKRETKELNNKILQLKKKLDAKQALELEVQHLKGNLNVMKHIHSFCLNLSCQNVRSAEFVFRDFHTPVLLYHQSMFSENFIKKPFFWENE